MVELALIISHIIFYSYLIFEKEGRRVPIKRDVKIFLFEKQHFPITILNNI